MEAPPDPTYRELARHVRKFSPEPLLREIARMAAAEVHRRLMQGEAVQPPETPFTFAGVARTVLSETRTGGSPRRSASRARRRRERRRHSDVSTAQVRALCDEMIRMWTPAVLAAGEKDVSVLMASIVFEQFGAQWSPLENLSRAYSLFVDAPVKHPDLPTAADWAAELGVDLDGFMRTGFALHVAMLHNQGQVSREVLKGSNVRPIWGTLSPEELFDVVDRHFVMDFVDHRRVCREAQQDGWEKWSFNSLSAAPLIKFGEDLVGPAPHLVLDKVSSTGLWYIGQKAWGSTFTTALGGAFEDYVGQNLQLLQHATVIPQIAYKTGSGHSRSCDWIVVTDEVVLLVEVKCARPLYGVRLGDPKALHDLRSKVSSAVGQLETTANLVRAAHPNFSAVPTDRPLLGLIVTLEPYYLRETFRDEMLKSDVLPVSIAWSHELENACAQLGPAADVGAQLLKGLTPKENPLVVTGSLRDIAYEGPVKRNPIVDASWDTWATWPGTD
jgi:hypothetical protein